jgi:hypothetical protein
VTAAVGFVCSASVPIRPLIGFGILTLESGNNAEESSAASLDRMQAQAKA